MLNSTARLIGKILGTAIKSSIVGNGGHIWDYVISVHYNHKFWPDRDCWEVEAINEDAKPGKVRFGALVDFYAQSCDIPKTANVIEVALRRALADNKNIDIQDTQKLLQDALQTY